MRHVYAILRSDDFLADLDISAKVTVKKIVWTVERAESEVERLNKANADKNCRYFYQLTRLEEESDYLPVDEIQQTGTDQ